MVHEAAASIDEQAMRVTRTIEVRAPIFAVWEALTEPARMAEWFGETADFPDGVHAGATGTFGWSDAGLYPVRIDRHERPSAFAFTWGVPGEPIRPDNSTTASFELVRDGDVTRLTVVEVGFERIEDAAARRAALEDNRRGWTSELDELLGSIARHWMASTVDPVAGTIARTLEVEAAPEEVWAHLTDPDAIEAWWGHPADFPGGMRAGVTGTFAWEGQTFPLAIRIADAPRTLAFRWGELGEAEPGPTAADVRFDLEPSPRGTRVTVVEWGWLRTPEEGRGDRMQQNARGWELVLDGLRRHVLDAAAARAGAARADAARADAAADPLDAAAAR